MADKKEEILEEALEQEEALQEEEATEAETAEAAEESADGEAGEDVPEETSEETPKTAAAQGEEKKGFFKKKKDKKDEQIEELNDKVKRQMAEFENFRKRTEKEKTQMYDMGARSIIEKILPVIDNFERGFTMVQEEGQGRPVRGRHG